MRPRLLGTRDMGQLFDVAEAVGARVILVGDRRQHRSVTAGEPLKLLEETAGLQVAEVTEILRQQGDYKKAAEALSEGRTEEGFAELDKLGWIKQVKGDDRDKQLAAAYLAAVAEKKRGGLAKSALVVSPTHAEGDRITQAIRAGLKAQGKLGKERLVEAWAPAHLTDAQKADPTEYEAGDLLQFHQNAPGYKKGSRLIVGDGVKATDRACQAVRGVPADAARPGRRGPRPRHGGRQDKRRQASAQQRLAAECPGIHQAGRHHRRSRLGHRSGFRPLTHGYVVTSHASQGVTVDKVFIGMSSESFPATYQRTAYVAVTRGREQAQIFTDDRKELLKAVSRPDDPLSATELAESAKHTPTLRKRLAKHMTTAQQLAAVAMQHHLTQSGRGRNAPAERGMDHDR